jgi:hypothetical protein
LVRDLLADLFNQHLGRNPDGIITAHVVPDAHSQKYHSSILPAHNHAAIFKSHHIVEVLCRTRAPLACTLRPPVTTLFSYYSYSREHGHVGQAVSLRDFCASTLPLWHEHLQIMLEAHRTYPGRLLFLHYGDEFPFRVTQLKALARHFDLPCPPGAAKAAVQRQRTFLAQLNADTSIAYWRGENTRSRQQMPEELRQEIEATTADVWEAAKTVAAHDKRLSRHLSRTQVWLASIHRRVL